MPLVNLKLCSKKCSLFTTVLHIYIITQLLHNNSNAQLPIKLANIVYKREKFYVHTKPYSMIHAVIIMDTKGLLPWEEQSYYFLPVTLNKILKPNFTLRIITFN